MSFLFHLMYQPGYYHLIDFQLGMSEKISFFLSGSHTGPSVNCMPLASFFTFAPGATSDV